MSNWPLLTLGVTREEDLVPARQRARRLAQLLGFDVQDRTRIATAVSEIARNAVVYAGGGRVEFSLEGKPGAQRFCVRVVDRGPGIADLDAVLEGRYQSATGLGVGLAGTRRLMDQFEITSTPGTGTVIRFGKALPRGAVVARTALADIAATLAADVPPDTLAELQAQNRELLANLAELRARQDDLHRLNAELEDTNRGVVALYAELDERADELRRASELKSRFLSDMSHEFRTPLNSIMALARLLLDRTDGDLSGEQERQVGYIERSARSLTDLVNDLLDLAKVEAGKAELRLQHFTVAELFSTLRGVLKPLQTNEAVDLIFEAGSGATPLYTDEGKVSQILRNLISNALKFTEHGFVRVIASHDEASGLATFVVSDSGIGIAEEDQERIFLEFTQVESPLQGRVKGTGLGLPLSRRLAELLGGKLRLASRPGQGSAFSLTIPVRLLRPPDTLGTEQHGQVMPRILLIDDEEAARYVLRHLIGNHGGFEVSEAADGLDGLRKAREQRPDLIVLDLRMPGLDGFQVLQRLHEDEATRAIPVIICTSSLLTAADHRRLQQAVAVLPKAALSREQLHQAMARALGSGEASPWTP
jgi:signal transduction histidine kinase/CheY-like chemotaxis protein